MYDNINNKDKDKDKKDNGADEDGNINSLSMKSNNSGYSMWSATSNNYTTISTSNDNHDDNDNDNSNGGGLSGREEIMSSNNSVGVGSAYSSAYSSAGTGGNFSAYGSAYGSCYNTASNSAYSSSYRSLYEAASRNGGTGTSPSSGYSSYGNIKDSLDTFGDDSDEDSSDNGSDSEDDDQVDGYENENQNENQTSKAGKDGNGYGYDEGEKKKKKQPHKRHNIPKVNIFKSSSSSSSRSKSRSKKSSSKRKDPEFGDWNYRFQSAMDRPESGEKYQVLSEIVNDFVHCASTFGKIIIAERFLSHKEKTIKPLSMGGVAGGEKFRCNDIVFKFVVDVEIAEDVWMYGGSSKSDEKAQKSAGHELKGWNNVFDFGSKLIRLPLMTIIDFAGYRLLAICSLPLGKNTIVYGSNNGGQTINNSDPLVEKEMEKIAAMLNLKGHQVGLTDESKQFIYGPGDIEVHKGNDGRYYMIDFARIFPPEYSGFYKETVGREIFYYMLRPELVGANSVPLCSDAFTAWQHSDQSHESNQEVMDATERLHNVLIAECVDAINEDVTAQSQLEGKFFRNRRDLQYYQNRLAAIEKLLHTVHVKGVNFRYLGQVCKLIKDIDTKTLLFTEMVARVIKKVIKDRLRDLVQISNRPSDNAIDIFTELFDLLLNKSPTAKLKNRNFWTLDTEGSFKYTAMAAYPNCLSPNQMSNKYDLRNSFNSKILAMRMLKIFSIRVRTESFEHFISSPTYVISYHDIESIGAYVKYPMIVDFSYGSYLLYRVQQGIENNSLAPVDLNRLMVMSQQKLQAALSSMPTSTKVVLKQANTYVQRSDLMTNCNEAIHYLEKANNVLRQQAGQQPHDPTVFYEDEHGNLTQHDPYAKSSGGDDPNSLALGGLILLKLATYKLFLKFDFPSFVENLTLSKEKFEKSLEVDTDYVEMYILQLLPFDSEAAGPDEESELGAAKVTPSIISEYRRFDFLSLIYLLSMCIEESSKLRPFISNMISEIRVISSFEVPVSVGQLFSSSITRHLFINIANVTRLSITAYTLEHESSFTITRLQHLTTLRLLNVGFCKSNDENDLAIQTYNHFFRELFPNAPMLTSIYLHSPYIDDEAFLGIPPLMGSLESLSIVQCPVGEKTYNAIAETIGANLKVVDIFSRYDSSAEKAVANLLHSTQSVRELSIHYRMTDDTSKEIVSYAQNLEKFVCNSQISGAHLTEIARLASNIVELDLSFTGATDDMIHALATHGAKSLKILKFSNTHVGRETDSTVIPTLTAMKLPLTVLHLGMYNGNTSDLWKLIASLPTLVELRMPDNVYLPNLIKEYKSNEFESIGSELSELKIIDLMTATVSPSTLGELLSMSPMIESISLSAITIITDQSYIKEMDDLFFDQILPLCVNVKHFNLANNKGLQKRHIEKILTHCKSLSSLDIYNCKLLTSQAVHDLGVQHPYIKFK